MNPMFFCVHFGYLHDTVSLRNSGGEFANECFAKSCPVFRLDTFNLNPITLSNYKASNEKKAIIFLCSENTDLDFTLKN